MSQVAKAQEPSMEEILASIRRIIADDDSGKNAKPSESSAPPASPPPPAIDRQSDIDSMLADLNEVPKVEPTTETRAEMKVETSFEPMAEPPNEAPPPPPVPDVLDLTEAHVAPPAPAPNFRTIDGDSDLVFTDRAPEPAPHQAEEVARRPAPSIGLISNNTAAAVDSAFNALAATVLGQNARTLEDLVKEMLRPMLKSWLDDNLPSLVERIVRAEIERVSRGKP